ncbi:hypothetical protein BJV74DRAFT_552315 [Russula compacta]|nr:hypothetical protein BJV74DRAFT_552315 [Russula compacta]
MVVGTLSALSYLRLHGTMSATRLPNSSFPFNTPHAPSHPRPSLTTPTPHPPPPPPTGTKYQQANYIIPCPQVVLSLFKPLPCLLPLPGTRHLRANRIISHRHSLFPPCQLESRDYQDSYASQKILQLEREHANTKLKC